MRKIIFLFIALWSLSASAQRLSHSTTWGYEFNRHAIDTLFAPPNDTFSVPVSLQSYPWVAAKSNSLYVWNTSTHVWQGIGGGSSSRFGLEDGTAGQDRVFDGASTYNFRFDNLKSFGLKASDSANIFVNGHRKLFINDDSINFYKPVDITGGLRLRTSNFINFPILRLWDQNGTAAWRFYYNASAKILYNIVEDPAIAYHWEVGTANAASTWIIWGVKRYLARVSDSLVFGLGKWAHTDPTFETPSNGYMYYNDSTQQFRGYRNGWTNFVMTGDVATATSNTNAGTGNDLVIENTQEVKRLNVAYGILKDSTTSKTNTLRADSATLYAAVRAFITAMAATPGVTTVGAINQTNTSSKGANGLAINTTTITAQTVGPTVPGMLSTGADTIQGAKVWTGNQKIEKASPLLSLIGSGNPNVQFGTTSGSVFIVGVNFPNTNDGYFQTAGNSSAPAIVLKQTNNCVGIGNRQLPASTIDINGSFAAAYVAKTANYTLTISDYTVNCTSGSFTITFPTSVGITGRVYIVKNSGAGTITLATTSSQTIDGAAPGTIAAGAVGQYQSTGANWIKIN